MVNEFNNEFNNSDRNPLTEALRKAEMNLSNLLREDFPDRDVRARKINFQQAIIRAYRRMIALVEEKTMPEVI